MHRAWRRPFTSYVESTSRPEIEHAFIKYPAKRAVEITDYEKSLPKKGVIDFKVLNDNLLRGKRVTVIHTHPCNSENHASLIGQASTDDLRWLVTFKDIKTMVMVPRHPETGQVFGFFIVKKKERAVVLDHELSEGRWNLGRVVSSIINRKHRKLIFDISALDIKFEEAILASSRQKIEDAYLEYVRFLRNYGLVWRFVSSRPHNGRGFADFLRNLERRKI